MAGASEDEKTLLRDAMHAAFRLYSEEHLESELIEKASSLEQVVALHCRRDPENYTNIMQALTEGGGIRIDDSSLQQLTCHFILHPDR